MNPIRTTPEMLKSGREAMEFYGGEVFWRISETSLERLAVFLAMIPMALSNKDAHKSLRKNPPMPTNRLSRRAK
jgi:hypothetical protein